MIVGLRRSNVSGSSSTVLCCAVLCCAVLCPGVVQELQDRLAASEAAAAASAAEHCDAMWAKGQVQGLMELNEVLQEQLETQGQELDIRAQEVEELRAALSR